MMGGVLGEVQEGCAPQLLLNDQGLLQQLEPSGQELVLDLQEIPFSHVHLEGLVDDCTPLIILDILPSSISMAHDPREQPVIMAPVPDLKLPPRHSSLFLILPQCVQLGEAAIRDVELEYELVLNLLDLLLVFLLSLVLGRLLVFRF